jgi:uncharacterized protein (TIGR00730 family)
MTKTYDGDMKKIKSICVYCGSRSGKGKSFQELALNVGTLLAKNNIELIYGGGNVGLMGIISTSVMDNGGTVHGIIPSHLDEREKSHVKITKLTIVNNMHQRKKMMFDHSDAFLVLPGSIGTLDETIEAITWAQLKLHDKPIIILNHENYWAPLMGLLNNIIENEFTNPETLKLFHVVNSADDVLPLLKTLPDPKIDPKNTLIK